MKKLITVIFIALLSISAFSQHDTTEDSVKVFINCKDTTNIDVICRDSAKIRCFPTPIIDSGVVVVASRHIYFITDIPSNIKFNEEFQKSADIATMNYFNSESWINELKAIK